MTRVRRSGVLLILMAAVVLEATATGYGAWILSSRLDALLPGRWLDNSGHELVFALGQTALLQATLLPMWFWKNLRDVGTLRLRWSWTLLLILPSALVNLAFFDGSSAFRNSLPRSLCLIWAGLATGRRRSGSSGATCFTTNPRSIPGL